MPGDNNNSKPASESVPSIQTQEVRCSRCKQPFKYFMYEIVGGMKHLRIGDVLVPQIRANCLHCGEVFHFNVNEKNVEKMTIEVGKLLHAMQHGYVPE